MVSNKTQAVIQALAYFDIFDYPLTKEEIEKFLPIAFSQKDIEMALKSKKVQQRGRYFFLAGRESIVTSRLEKEKISKEKLQKAQRILWPLRYIPTILYIGISGSLAMKNAKKTDDIDIFIITKPQTLWLSRLFVNSMLLFSGNLRRFQKKHTNDMICANMWVDADHLHFSVGRQNIYTAHEIMQLLPVCNKNAIYEEFLHSNSWLKKFFPNTSIEYIKASNCYTSTFLLVSLEYIAKKTQLFYMKKHRTTETIADGFVAFHPKDYTNQILQKWEEQQKKWNTK